MGVVYLAYCGSWQLSLHVPCFCAFYIFNTTPNPTSSSFFQNVFVLVQLGSLPPYAKQLQEATSKDPVLAKVLHHVTRG